jgi:hypothetical protein
MYCVQHACKLFGGFSFDAICDQQRPKLEVADAIREHCAVDCVGVVAAKAASAARAAADFSNIGCARKRFLKIRDEEQQQEVD